MRLKRIFIYCVVFVVFMLIGLVNVNAISKSNTEIECIYADGMVLGMRYDTATKTNHTYIKEYPVTPSVTVENDPVSSFDIYSHEATLNSLGKLYCPNQVYYYIALQGKGDDQVRKGWYMITAGGTITAELFSTKKTGSLWWKDTVATAYPEPVWFVGDARGQTTCPRGHNDGWKEDPDNKRIKNKVTGYDCAAYARLALLGERLYFIDDISDDAYSYSLKMYTEEGQAVSSNKYAQIYKYKSYSADANYLDIYGAPSRGNETPEKWEWRYMLQIGKTVTAIQNSDVPRLGEINNLKSKGNDVYVCISESTMVQDPSRGDGTYKIDSIRNRITKVMSDPKTTCPKGSIKYEVTSEVCRFDVGNSAGSFCDKYGNTAKVLIKIVKISQVLVPILVIVLTALEITKIVLAGNLEEELPKKKKSIIIRLIIMIVFFFLPLIVQIIVSWAEGVSIYDVSCLFNDGKQVIKDSDLECIEIE